MATFTINFTNNSSSAGSFCVFQQNPNSSDGGVFALAWLAQFAGPHTRLSIGWNTDYYFFWAKTGQLKPGVIFNAGEALRTDLMENNTVTLTKHDGNYQFVNQTKGYRQGMLTIIADVNTAINQASVGIGMSGSCTFAVQAQPNWTSVFEPRPEYWIAFGDFKQGQALDLSQMNNTARIEFPHGIFSMNAALNADGSWTIEQGMD